MSIDPSAETRRLTGFSGHVLLLGLLAASLSLGACEKSPIGVGGGAPKAEAPPADLPVVEVAKMVAIPFRLKFLAADYNQKNPTHPTIALNTPDRGNRTHFLELGDSLPEARFKVDSYDPNHMAFKDGVKQNVPLLTVIDQTNGEKVPLLQGVLMNLPELYVVLHLALRDGTPLPDVKLKKGDTFDLPTAPEKKFTVSEIKEVVLDVRGIVVSGEVTIKLPSGEKVVKKFPALGK